jgi:arylsulfatase A-like enzyme
LKIVPTGHPDSVNRRFRGIVTRDGWKYVVFEGAPFLMFNLNEDPYEMVNLAFNNRYRAERHKLADRIAQWVSETGDKFSVPRDITP